MCHKPGGRGIQQDGTRAGGWLFEGEHGLSQILELSLNEAAARGLPSRGRKCRRGAWAVALLHACPSSGTKHSCPWRLVLCAESTLIRTPNPYDHASPGRPVEAKARLSPHPCSSRDKQMERWARDRRLLPHLGVSFFGAQNTSQMGHAIGGGSNIPCRCWPAPTRSGTRR